MAVTLLLVFRSTLRLLPLVIALVAAALAFGLFGLLGGTLTMASIAVLPILIGLAVDYAIQFQSRYDEALEAGAEGEDASRLAALRGGPTIGTACLATGAGFLVLLLSPTPMVRSFALLLVVGVAIAFGLALTAGFSALTLRRSGRRVLSSGEEDLRAGARRPFSAPLTRRHPPVERLVSTAIDYPGRVLAVGVVLAVIGWGVGTQIEHRVRHPDAGPAEHRSGTGPRQAPGRHRGLGRARRPGRGPRPDRPGDAALDGGVQEARAPVERVLRPAAELPDRRSLPRAGALRFRHRPGAAPTRQGCAGNAAPAARLRPLAGRHRRPRQSPARARGAAQLRHPRAIVGGPAGADRPGSRRGRRAGQARRAAAGRPGRARRASGHSRRRGRRPLAAAVTG